MKGVNKAAKVEEAIPTSTGVDMAARMKDPSIKGSGRNIAHIGPDSSGKTTAALMWGYLNSRYFNQMGDDFPLTKKALKCGAVPEVEKIYVVETQNKLKKTLDSRMTVEYHMMNQLIQDGTAFHIEEIPMRRLIETIVNGKVVANNIAEIEATAKRFSDELYNSVKLGPEYLFVVDSMSDFYRILDDKQGLMYQYILKAKFIDKDVDQYSKELVEAAGSLKQMRDASWSYRNKWWFDPLIAKKAFLGWNVDTYYESEKTIRENMESGGYDGKIFWPKGTPGHIDAQFHFNRGFDDKSGSYNISVEMLGKQTNPVKALNKFIIPTYKKLGGLQLFEHMAHAFLIDEGMVSY